MTPRSFVLLLITCLAALAAACDVGNEQRGALPSYTPAAWVTSPTATPMVFPVDMADQVAHAALPQADAFGLGWKVTKVDDFSPSDRGIKDTPGCESLARLGPETGDGVGRVEGKAKQDYSGPKSVGLFPTTAIIEAEVYSEALSVDAAVRTYRALVGSEEFAKCMGAAFAAGAGPGVDVASERRDSRVHAQEDWASGAVEVKAEVAGKVLDVRMDLYAVPYGNAVITAMFIGPTSDVNEAFVGHALDEVARGMKALAADPSADPHGTLTDGAGTDASFSADDFAADSMKPVAEYVHTFCDASMWWLDWLGDRQMPETSGTNSEVRGHLAAFLNGLRDGMDMYIDRVIEAGYPDSTDGRKLAADIVGVLQSARGYYDAAANRVEGFSIDPAEFQLEMADLELDLRKGALNIIEEWVRISGEYDVSAFAAAVAATPGCKAPWDEGGPSGTF